MAVAVADIASVRCQWWFVEERELDTEDADDSWEDNDHPEWAPFEDNPGGFLFPCCYRDGESKGCQRYRHVGMAEDKPVKRSNISLSDVLAA